MKRALARFLLGLVLRLEGLAERLDPQGYPKTIDVEHRPSTAPLPPTAPGVDNYR
jgi:hypothetical protein